jgi:hypothetical protein
MDSGTGAYLLYAVDLPNDDTSRDLIKGLLDRLARRFDDAATTIDTGVFNAARIMRTPGTLNAKGDNKTDRPHRRARLVSVPEDRVTVDVELLAAVAKPERPTTNDEAAPGRAGESWRPCSPNTTGKRPKHARVRVTDDAPRACAPRAYWGAENSGRRGSGARRRRTLYRLAQVREAVAAGKAVHLVEGGQDVHAMESLSVVATTAPMGARNFRKVNASPLFRRQHRRNSRHR